MESSLHQSAVHVACEAIVREQIEILWDYQRREAPLDPAFIENHARMIVQIVGYMKGPDERGDAPGLSTLAREQP